MIAKQNFTSWVLIVLIYLSAFLLQTHIFMNWDVSLLMHTTSRMLAGGHYGVNFFDTDPPMILFIYTIPVLAAQFFSLSFVTTNLIFTLLVSMLSLLLCAYFIKRLPSIYKSPLLLPAVAAIMLLPPAMNFAQREHLMLILILPYLMLTALRLEKPQLALRWTYLSGLLAGVGFAIKPHFYLCFVLLELYYMWRSRSQALLKWIRPESWIIVGVALLYLLVIAAFYQSYLQIILPTILQYYYVGLENLMSFIEVITDDYFLFSLITAALFFVLLHQEKEKSLEAVLLAALLGFILAYVLQKTYWYYHVLPAFSLACLLWMQMWYRYIKSHFDAKPMVLGLLFFLVLFYPLKLVYELNKISVQAKKDGIITHLIEHLQAYPRDSSVYFFSGCLLPYPAVDYLHLKEEQIAQTYWFMPGIILGKNQTQKKVASQTSLDPAPVLGQIVQDFTEKKPDIVVVDKRINCNGFPFDFREYFSQDPAFKTAFEKYRWVDGYETVDIYVQKGVS